MAAYHSGRRLASAITVFVGLRLALYVVSIGLWWTISDRQDVDTVALIESGGSILYVIGAILFLIWVHGATRNLAALGSESIRISPSDAVWGYLIPLVNLVRGHQVMANLWTESQPTAAPEPGIYVPGRTTLVNLWWGLHLFGGFVSIVYRSAHTLAALSTRFVVLDTIFLASGVCFLWVVRAVQSRQDEQWKDIRLRNAVPAPTADVLR